VTAAARRAATRRLLLSSLQGRAPVVRRLMAWSLVEALPAFFSGLLVARAIDDGFLDGDTTTGLAWLGVLAVSVLVGGWGTRQTFLRLADVVEPFRDELVKRTVDGALAQSTAHGVTPDTAGVARLTQQVEIVREAYASVLLVVQGFIVSAVAALLGLLTLMPEILLLVLPPLFIGLGLFLAALPGMTARQRDSILADERIAEAAGIITGGLRDVVACGAEERVAASVGEHIDAQARATRELARFTAVRTIAAAVGGLLPILLILACGSWLLRNGASTGVILGALTYVAQGVQPALQTLVRGLANTGLWLSVTLARIVESTEVTAAPQAPQAPAAPAASRAATAGHAVALRDVTFAYGPDAEPVVRDLDLTVEEGDHLTIVGISGAGKSTLANLVAGLLTPQKGELRLRGVPVGELDATGAARSRVVIPQEAYVFAGTLRENLEYLAAGSSTALLDEAVNLLGARQLVDRLGGYDAPIDPASLSAGERQLMTLVRSYVSPAPIIILDEATCHLDPAAEARVERAFAARAGTLLVIAHRISSARRARRILLLDGGRALLGSDDDLLRGSPLYRELVGYWSSGSPTERRAATDGMCTPPKRHAALDGSAQPGGTA
jgi:ABC-type multidrug transport system fused ATPase/permease subunit